MELQDYLVLIRRRLWILLTLPTIAAVFAGLLSFFVLTPIYEASATVWVIKQDRTPPTMNDLMFNRSLVRTYGEIAKGRRVLEQVIVDANLPDDFETLYARVNISGVDGTEIMRITVADPNPELAAEIANSVARAFSNEIRQFMQLENVRLVEEAIPPAVPVRPSKFKSLLIGTGLGVGAALGLVILLEALDMSMRSRKDVQRHLQLRVLGTVPPIDGLVTTSAPNSEAAEAFRILRTTLLSYPSERPLQTLLLTSAAQGEGRSLTTANLAVALAQQGANVLVIDACLRRPGLSKLFGLGEQLPGLAELLRGSGTLPDVVVPGPVAGLSVMPSGAVPPNPTELIGSPRMAKVLAGARDQYDYVLLDAPPALGLSDAMVLAPEVDGALLVVRAGLTPYPMAQHARDSIQAVGARTLGVVLMPVHEGTMG